MAHITAAFSPLALGRMDSQTLLGSFVSFCKDNSDRIFKSKRKR